MDDATAKLEFDIVPTLNLFWRQIRRRVGYLNYASDTEFWTPSFTPPRPLIYFLIPVNQRSIINIHMTSSLMKRLWKLVYHCYPKSASLDFDRIPGWVTFTRLSPFTLPRTSQYDRQILNFRYWPEMPPQGITGPRPDHCGQTLHKPF